jgi:hypothetical protein
MTRGSGNERTKRKDRDEDTTEEKPQPKKITIKDYQNRTAKKPSSNSTG